MGEIRAYLPPNVRLAHVIKVLGILFGCRKSKRGRWTSGGGVITEVIVKGVHSRPMEIPAVAHVDIDQGDIPSQWTAEYWFESAGGRRFLFPTYATTGRTQAGIGGALREDWSFTMVGLVNFFGGTVQWDSSGQRYEMPYKTDLENQPLEDNDTYALNRRLWELKPLNKEQKEIVRTIMAVTTSAGRLRS